MSAVVRTVDPRLWDLTVTTTAGVTVTFKAPTEEDGDDGTAGVREPRRPTAPVGTLAAEVVAT